MMEDHHDVGQVHHHSVHHGHGDLPEIDHDHVLGSGTVHSSENLVEAPGPFLDAKDMSGFTYQHHPTMNHMVNHNQHQHQQIQMPKKSKAEPKKRTRTNNNNNTDSITPTSPEDKKRGRPNVPIQNHSNPSVKYRRVSDTVDRLTNETDFLKKMINSDWGRKEFFETHALWHSKIIQNIATSLKTLPNNSPLRKQIIHLIGEDIPAAVLARLLEVSEKTVYRSRKLDQLKILMKPEKEKSPKDNTNQYQIDDTNIQSIQSVVVNHEIEDDRSAESNDESLSNHNPTVHDMMRASLQHPMESNSAFNFGSNFSTRGMMPGLE